MVSLFKYLGVSSSENGGQDDDVKIRTFERLDTFGVLNDMGFS